MKSRWLPKPPAAVWFGLVAVAGLACSPVPPYVLEGELTAHRPLRVTVEGPEAAERGDPNPFVDFRMEVVFRHESGETFRVPGFFAADGRAADTGAGRGNKWQAYFLPARTGRWSFRVSLRSGNRIVLQPQAEGTSVAGNGVSGEFYVAPVSEEKPPRGLLRYVGRRYLQFAGDGTWFLKAGADSPENFLAYEEFDWEDPGRATPEAALRDEAQPHPRHRYEPHVGDWRPGDPTWGEEARGKGIIGALNYLAAQGVNSVYFLTMNIGGDGNDVWPYLTREDRYRFDCSRLDQWNRVFDHMDRLGIALHVVLTETENESLFEAEEGGTFADSRKLYYRELVARFAHHPALVWNLGEENGWNDAKQGEEVLPKNQANTDEQRVAFATYLRELDPYDHPIVVHTLPGDYDKIYQPLLGSPVFEGASLQMGDMTATHAETLKWIRRSQEAGRPWVVTLDEIGPASDGVLPDEVDPDHNAVRQHALWGNLMAGGAGCEWYFGYRYPHNDLNLEDFRSREKMWEQTRIAVEFFHRHLPFWEMEPCDELLDGPGYCLGKRGGPWAVYLPRGAAGTRMTLPEGTYAMFWFDPRTGGDLFSGRQVELAEGWQLRLSHPPREVQQDWVVLLRRR